MIENRVNYDLDETTIKLLKHIARCEGFTKIIITTKHCVPDDAYYITLKDDYIALFVK